MELHKITWVVGTIGLSVMILSLIKWFFLTLYLSKLMFGLGIGFGISCLAYLHECLKLRDKKYAHDEKRITELEFWAKTKGFDNER